MRKGILILLLMLLGAPALAQPESTRVQLETSEGAIVVAVDPRRAPVTAANFLRYVDQGRFEGAAFYRAMKVGPAAGLVQGGVDPHRALPPIAHEPTTRTGLSHTDGAVSLARYAPGTATADFFITVGDMTFLDANPAAPGDNAGFAVFARVVEGMDVVRRILAAPTSPTEGEGAMRGQMLSPRIAIRSARRVE